MLQSKHRIRILRYQISGVPKAPIDSMFMRLAATLLVVPILMAVDGGNGKPMFAISACEQYLHRALRIDRCPRHPGRIAAHHDLA